MKPAELARYLSHGTPESSKRLIAYQASRVLMFCQVCLTIAILWQAFFLKVVEGGALFHPVDNGLLGAWTLGAGILAALAREIYRKPEGGGDA